MVKTQEFTANDDIRVCTIPDPDMPSRSPDGVVENVFFWLGRDAVLFDDEEAARQ